MRVDQAKAIAMWDLLSSMGHAPQRNDKGEWWYTSPFRQESDPSFKVTKDGKAWFDHGIGKGGNILDFIMQHQRTDLRGALRFLDNLPLRHAQPQGEMPASSTAQPSLWNSPESASEARTASSESSGQPSTPKDRDGAFTVTKIQPLENRALIHYLKQRGIEASVAGPWVQEMYYRRHGKPYFALAFANDAGGHELRNPYFKGVVGSKEITVIEAGEGDPLAVAVFEGFMDFLSLLMVVGHPPAMPVIVLNSVAMQEKASRTIRQMGVETVHLYLDRDRAGQELVEYFKAQLPEQDVADESSFYKGFKDVNAWLVDHIQTSSLAV